MTIATEPARTSRRFDANASLVLIGVPSTGKRSLGFIAASHLKRRFCTENGFFETTTGFTKAAYLEQHGREAFLSKSIAVLQQLLDENTNHCVIECGANSLAPTAKQLLAAYALTHPVAHITRELSDVLSHSRLPPLDAERLRQLDAGHRVCSNFEFYNVFDNTSTSREIYADEDLDVAATPSPVLLRKAKLSFCTFVDAILGRRSPSPGHPFNDPYLYTSTEQRTFSTVWRLSRLMNGSLCMSQDVSGVNAIELIVDTWTSDILEVISKFVAGIRHHVRLPVIYSVDCLTASLTEAHYWKAIAHGLRLGVDSIVINGYAPDGMHQWLRDSKGHTTIISHYEVDGTGQPHAWRHRDRDREYVLAQRRGYDLVRMVQFSNDRSDNEDLQHFRQKLRVADDQSLPLVAYNTGESGRSSKIHNIMLTPVCTAIQVSDDLAATDRIGNVTIKDITQALFASWEYDQLHFQVYGTPERAYSRSPNMYKAAFELYGLSHTMKYRSALSIDEVLDCSRSEHFGGGAVSFPFKEAAFDACELKSKDAIAIGSVNSIIPLRILTKGDRHDLAAQAAQRNRRGRSDGLYGENCDWLGFYHSIQNNQSPRNAVLGPQDAALVLGAGGSARAAIYALISLGYRNICIRNRTVRKAEEVAKHFYRWCRRSEYKACKFMWLNPSDESWPIGINLPTVIIACVPTENEFHLPDAWLSSSTGGVAAEIAYKQTRSLFLEQVKKQNSSNGRLWSTVDGHEVLLEIAVVQFEFLTGYRAPRAIMEPHLRGTEH